MTSTTASRSTSPVVSLRSVPLSIAGGLAGGVVFGLMMQMMGMLGMVGMLVGSESLVVAWLAHLAISAAIGAGFGLVLAPRVNGLGAGLGFGAAYGLLWWVLGPLLLMPAAMGMPVLSVDATAGQSLLGHLAFGLAGAAPAPVRLTGPRGREVRLTHAQLADLVGTTRETTTKALGDLQARGVVALRRGAVVVLDLEGLVRLSDELL